MYDAWVLMTALPPTKGHMHLGEFASNLVSQVGGKAHIIVCTQPHEPFPYERYEAVASHFERHRNVRVHWLDYEVEQDPEAPGFWETWDEIMLDQGFEPGDFVVTSEPYGKTLAQRLDGEFMPYDPERELYYTKATLIRNNPGEYFHDIAHEFQHNLRQVVTVFGAESTGKTTLSKALSYSMNGHWLFEYARPYLTHAENVIDTKHMTAIWRGQQAIQRHGLAMLDKPWVIQDTDLYSTLGYWEFPEWLDMLGQPPFDLGLAADEYKSDLYLITTSNIPFEKDPLRYKSDEGRREHTDEWWIDFAEKYKLNYKVITADTLPERMTQAQEFMTEHWATVADKIDYDRYGL